MNAEQTKKSYSDWWTHIENRKENQRKIYGNEEVYQLNLVDTILKGLSTIVQTYKLSRDIEVCLGINPDGEVESELYAMNVIGDDFLEQLQTIGIINNLNFKARDCYDEIVLDGEKMKVPLTEMRYAIFNCHVDNLKKYLRQKKDEVSASIRNKEKIRNNPKSTVIYFNKDNGTGEARKKFKFSKKSRPYLIFSLLYNSINTPITRGEVLDVMGLLEEGEKEKGSQKIDNTQRITQLSKLIRKKTGLTNKELVQDGGLMLLGIGL